jgi:ATP-binding cassette subfamily F protein uup
VALARPSNLLVLDEPTNDLDLETLDLLQEMLADYAGTVLLVSHDRDFIDRVATSVLAFEGDGRWVEYAGGYSDMLAQRGEALPGKARRASEPARSRVKLEATAPSPAHAPAQAPAPRKLSFKDRHALQSLPARMEALRAEAARQTAILADPALYARHPARFRAASDALARAQAELAEAEERWLELELMREEIEGG